MTRLVVVLASSALLLGAGCSSSTPSVQSSAPADAAVEATAPAGCEDACKSVTLQATLASGPQSFDRAQFGAQGRDGDGGGVGYHVEAHKGGDAACPTERSPTPDWTLVVTNIPALSRGQTATDADGVRAAFFDFVTPGAEPLVKATRVEIKATAADAAEPPSWIAFDVDATLPRGTVKGHVYATYCQSLSP